MCLPFRQGLFDKIIAADFIEHITDEQKERMLEEVMRVSKEGATIVIFTPNGIREIFGYFKRQMRRLLELRTSRETTLHFGLTTRSRFEALLRKHKVRFEFAYVDMKRPYLTTIPFLKRLLSLKLMWVITKKSQ